MLKIFSKLENHKKIKVVSNSKVQTLKSKPSIEDLKSMMCINHDWDDPSMVISQQVGEDSLKISLLQNNEKKISVRVNFLAEKSKVQKEYWICRDDDKSDKVIWIYEMFFATESSFIEPEVAVAVIFELIESQSSAFSKYNWLDSDNINWPDELV